MERLASKGSQMVGEGDQGGGTEGTRSLIQSVARGKLGATDQSASLTLSQISFILLPPMRHGCCVLVGHLACPRISP